jgi:hypothetical protein
LFGTDLKPFNIVFPEEVQMLLWYWCELSLVALVDEAVNSIFWGILLGLFHPVAKDVLKRLGVGGIIH